MKPLIRPAFRILARFVSRRPLLVTIAARALVLVPPLKRYLRSLIAEPVFQVARSECSLSPDEARVLVDLREALARRSGVRQ